MAVKPAVRGAAPTDPHTPRPSERREAPLWLPVQSLPSPMAPTIPKIKFLPMVLRESLSFCLCEMAKQLVLRGA